MYAVVYGHSYVRRLGDYIDDMGNNFTNFGFDGTRLQVLCSGVGGGKVYPGRKSLQASVNTAALSEYEPHICFLQAGENDINIDTFNTETATKLATALINFAAFLQHSFSINHIIIGQLLPRMTSGFTRCVVEVNKALQQQLATNDHTCIHFWHHRGFWQDPSQLFSRDGVHFNDKGTMKYAKSVRAALGTHLKKYYPPQ